MMEFFSKIELLYMCSIEGRRYRAPPNFPTRFHPSDMIEFGSDKKVTNNLFPVDSFSFKLN
jgi:zeaxanthin epoxidase